MKDHGISLKPVRPGGPPVYIAGLAEAAGEARGADRRCLADRQRHGLGTTAPLMQTYRAALQESGTHADEFPIARECYVGASHATAHEECRAALEYKYNAYAAWGLESPHRSMTFEDLARDRFIIGDKVSVKEEIARYRELLGVDHFIMRCQWPGLPQEQGAGLDPPAGRDLRMMRCHPPGCVPPRA